MVWQVASIRLKYVLEDTDRHGNVRLYFRKPGCPKVRLRGPIGSSEFFKDYEKASKAAPALRLKTAEPLPGSMRWLCSEYLKSPAFRNLAPKTRLVRQRILERLCSFKEEGSAIPDGDRSFAGMRAKHVRAHRDRLSATPAMANALVKSLRTLFAFAIRYDHTDRNPATDVELFPSVRVDGLHSWSIEEISQFEGRHPVGTTARLTLALALYTGQRRGDLAVLGRQHLRTIDGVEHLCFTQEKGRNKSPIRLAIPVIPELRRIIDSSPTGDLTYIAGANGRPLLPNSLGNSFRDWCNEAGLPQCSLHGLRKAAATRLADLGASAHEIAAITGHKTLKEVSRYTRAADQRKLAGSAAAMLSAELSGNKSVPLSCGEAESGTKTGAKKLKRQSKN